MSATLSHHARVLGSAVTSSLRLWRGTLVVRAARTPAQPLRLYEFEGCPFCRAVREALTALHLDAEIYPCPRGGERFRPAAIRLGGKQQFPLLIDRAAGLTLYESADIVAHLFRTYGAMDVPRMYRPGPRVPVTNSLASLARGARGVFARPSRAPAQPLALWSFESSPYSRLVRERLCELELPYRLHNLGKEHWTEAGPATRRIQPNPYVPRPGGKRDAFYQKHGRVQVPYLEDPNTGAAMFESAAILAYLERTYAA